ncbi:Uncharacterised protein [Vibrio cholerae]|uniref:Uncharacterized protein n=1 Tax=Vibrio cholerae TaxID=666 RepID=A0A655ZZP5_VIBCL|nr:Uncharacterised protein [Vibrio cholerae]CRZ57722.1 Uncharacterised protein [Vibrio cholerae]CRZ60176.1 Uncharacterised protein [Vibrio cholerae]CRZ64347.1 Uncharacterised protein [Vibrio cholerae]CRZ68572.1 Uncharacterised protein [Vibrio cholerae]
MQLARTKFRVFVQYFRRNFMALSKLQHIDGVVASNSFRGGRRGDNLFVTGVDFAYCKSLLLTKLGHQIFHRIQRLSEPTIGADTGVNVGTLIVNALLLRYALRTDNFADHAIDVKASIHPHRA